MGTIMEGMAFGTGSAIAHRVVGAVAGSVMGGGAAAAPAPEAAPASAASVGRGQDCSSFQREFAACLQQNRSDLSMCQSYSDNLQQCNADARLH
jgi:hypothetical protein